MTDINRRKFVRTGVMAGVAVAATGERVVTQGPAVRTGAARPVVIASGNGNRFKNGGNRTCVEEAFRLLIGGSDPLDAVIAGGKLQNVTLKSKVPVLLAYWTAWVDAEGRMNFRRDLYGQDAQWAEALDAPFRVRTRPLFVADGR